MLFYYFILFILSNFSCTYSVAVCCTSHGIYEIVSTENLSRFPFPACAQESPAPRELEVIQELVQCPPNIVFLLLHE